MKPYTCPVCRGQKTVSKPPHIAGDVNEWVNTTMEPYPCKVCKGEGVLWSKAEAELEQERDRLSAGYAAIEEKNLNE